MPAVLPFCLKEARILAYKPGADQPVGFEVLSGRVRPSELPETGLASCLHVS